MVHKKNNNPSNSISNSTINAGNIILGNNNTLTNNSKEKSNLQIQSIPVASQEVKPDKEHTAKTMEKVFHVLKNSSITNHPEVIMRNKLQPLITLFIPWLGQEKKFYVL